jgi:hypothetical protein
VLQNAAVTQPHVGDTNGLPDIPHIQNKENQGKKVKSRTKTVWEKEILTTHSTYKRCIQPKTGDPNA